MEEEKTYLEIGYPLSKFISGGGIFKVTTKIPTDDLKEIIMLWISFLKCK